MLDYMVRFGLPIDIDLEPKMKSLSIKVLGHELGYFLIETDKGYVALSRMLVQFKAKDVVEDRTVSVVSESGSDEEVKMALAKLAQQSLHKAIEAAGTEEELKKLILPADVTTVEISDNA